MADLGDRWPMLGEPSAAVLDTRKEPDPASPVWPTPVWMPVPPEWWHPGGPQPLDEAGALADCACPSCLVRRWGGEPHDAALAWDLVRVLAYLPEPVLREGAQALWKHHGRIEGRWFMSHEDLAALARAYSEALFK